MKGAAQGRKVLFLSVGGSEPPLRSSILEIRPDQVVFVVSDGSGGSQSSKEKAINLFNADGCPESREVIEVPPDNLDSALGKIEPRLNQFLRQGSEVTVDYTGGTKSMTSAMVLAATCYSGVRLQFMAGVRKDLESVRDGTEESLEIPKDLIGLSQTFGTVRAFIERRNYGAALSILIETDKKFENLQGKVPRTWRRRTTQWRKWVSILDLWDRFYHVEARKKFRSGLDENEPHSKWIKENDYSERLEKLASCERRPAPELIEDLWLNAQRKADLGLYDDAIARLYRLAEAAAQANLFFGYGVRTDDVPLEILPDSMRNKLRSSEIGRPIKLPLAKSIELLGYLNPRDPLAKLLADEPKWIPQRNHSILAHGFTPLGRHDWKTAENWFDQELKHVWEKLLERSTACQLPNRLPNFI